MHRVCKMTSFIVHCSVDNLRLICMAHFAQFFVSVTVCLVPTYCCHCKASAVKHQVHLNHAGQSGIPVFEIALVRGLMVLSISYVKAFSTQHTCPHALGKRYATQFCLA